jgi:hypothetical protein
MWRNLGAKWSCGLAILLALCLAGCSGLDTRPEADREPETVSEWLAQPKPGF